jgi:hypothetical protein
MPAQAQLSFEWHLVSTVPAPAGQAATNVTAATNPAVTQNFFTGANALVEGQTVILQLMIRDNNPMGMTFPWAWGDGIQSPPISNINGVGILAWGAIAQSGNGSVFGPTGPNPTPTNFANNRPVPPIESELIGPDVPLPASTYPLPPGDYSGNNFRPYSVSFSAFSATNARADAITNLLDVGSPWENGDFPRQRAGGGFLMPLFNMRFTAVAPGSTTLNLVDPNPTAADILVTGPNGAVMPGGDMLDAGMFSSYVPLNIQVVPVPEPTSMALVGMAIAGLGYRKLRRKKTTEVAA